MKNIDASVGAVPTQEQKAVKGGGVEEECNWRENEIVFYLREDPDCQISAIGGCCENARGEMVGSADICFRHVITGKRCDSVWNSIYGTAGFDRKWADGWEKLAIRIEDVLDLGKIVCNEKIREQEL